jgi:hypothetical protein
MTTVSEAIKVMGVVAACHHRTAPRMDDREAVLAIAGVWADLFSTHHLELPDLIAAVKKRATSHPDAPEPADIITVARGIRMDRADRETRDQRAAREELLDAKAEGRKAAINQFVNQFTKELS